MTIIQAQPLKAYGISGPASALDNEVPIFDGITGKKIKAATGITSPSSGRLEVEGGSFPVLSIKRTSSSGAGVYGAMALERTVDYGNGADGFGVGQYFLLEDDAGNEGDFAGFFGAKWQSSTSGSEVGALVFTPAYYNNDPYNKTPSMVIVATGVNFGNVGVGTIDPTAKLDIGSDILRLRTAKTPASAGAAGNQGDMCWDADFHYRCVATNTWKRTALTTW